MTRIVLDSSFEVENEQKLFYGLLSIAGKKSQCQLDMSELGQLDMNSF